MRQYILRWLQDPSPAGILAILIILALASAIVLLLCLPVKADIPAAALSFQPPVWDPVTDMDPLVDPLPVTEEVPPPANYEKARLVGRLANGIHKVRTMKGKAPFWFCGEPHEGQEAMDLALVVAWNIVTAVEQTSTVERPINVWEVAGLASNESGFDLCSLGLYPRKAAYEMGVLKRRRETVSHTRAEIEKVLADPRMQAKFRAFDLCMLQTLTSHYRADRMGQGEKWQHKDLLTWAGFRWQVEYFHQVMIRHNTATPSLYWPGHKSQWKLDKVKRFARQLGARADEI